MLRSAATTSSWYLLAVRGEILLVGTLGMLNYVVEECGRFFHGWKRGVEESSSRAHLQRARGQRSAGSDAVLPFRYVRGGRPAGSP